MINISNLKLNPKNPRKISKKNLEKLCKSIKKFEKMLSIRPIIVDENNMVLGGNMRLKSLKKLGYKEIPDEWVKKISDLNEEEKKQFLIKDNLEYGEFDEDILKLEFDDFDLKDWDLDLDFEMDWGDDEEEDIKEDECPALKKESIVKIGDKWILGNNILKCGDSTKKEDVEDLINDNKINLIITDPPYEFISKNPNGGGFMNNNNKKHLEKIKKTFGMSFEPQTFFNIIKDKLEKFNSYIFTNKNLIRDYINLAEQNNFSWDILIWKKINPVPLNNNHYLIDKEYCFYIKNKSSYFNKKLDFDNYKTINEFPIGKKYTSHPTEKPVDLLKKYIKISSQENEIILDLFGGSGSTLIACEQLNRRCFVQEICPLFSQLIIDRYINFKQNNGKDVFLLKDGKKIPYKEIIKKNDKTIHNNNS